MGNAGSRWMFSAKRSALIGGVSIVLLGCSASPNPHANARSICSLGDWDEYSHGRRATVRADFHTDFHHGESLSDPACPGVRFSIEPDSQSRDRSVDRFYDTLWANQEEYRGSAVEVLVEVTFHWLPARVVNEELPESRQLRIPARGSLSIERVLSHPEPRAEAR